MSNVLAQDLRDAVLQAAFEGKLTKTEESDLSIEETLSVIKNNKTIALQNGDVKKTKALPKITDESIPFEIPEKWRFCYIDDFAFVTKLAGFEYTKYIAKNIQSEGIPLFKGKNVQDGKLILEFESYISKELSDSLKRSQLSKKCLLTPYVGTIGNIALFNGTFEAHLGSNVGKIEIFNNPHTIVKEEYLLYYLRSWAGYAELSKFKKATAQESISIDAIRNVIVPICSPEEQARIVAKVDELMAKIDEYEKIEKKLVELHKKFPGDMKDAILKAAFSGGITKRCTNDSSVDQYLKECQAKRLEYEKQYKEKKHKSLWENGEYETRFDIPKEWRWAYVGDVFRHNAGKALNVRDTSGSKRKYLTTSNIYTDHFELDNLREMYYTDEEVEKYSVQKGDLLVLEGGDFGRTALWDLDDSYCIQNHLHRLRLFVGGDIKYFFYLLSFYKDAGYTKGKGIAIQGLSANALHNIVIPIPPIEEQQRIVEKLDKLLPLCDSLEKLIA